MKISKKSRKILLSVSLSFLVLFAISFMISFTQIYKGVKNACISAKNVYGKNCQDSLVEVIRSEKGTAREKNNAVWALGQLASKETLPFLVELNRNLDPDLRCKYDECISKYEVEKAIKWCERGNVTHWMYENKSWL